MDYHNLSPHSWSSEIKYVITELQLLNNFEIKSAVELCEVTLRVLDTNCATFAEVTNI